MGGPDEVRSALDSGRVQPLSLAQGDFNGDGMPDLLVGYSDGRNHFLALYRGNSASVLPDREGVGRYLNGQMPATPFLPGVLSFVAPALPELLATGDFDADGKLDLVLASRSEARLYWLVGDGGGTFEGAGSRELPGPVFFLESADIDRPDGLADLLLLLDEGERASLLILQGSQGALEASDRQLSLNSFPGSLAVGTFDADSRIDLAVGDGSDLLILHGQEPAGVFPAESAGAEDFSVRARISRIGLGARVLQTAAAELAGSRQPALLVTTLDGTLTTLLPEAGSYRVWSRDDFPNGGAPAPQIQPVRSPRAPSGDEGGGDARLLDRLLSFSARRPGLLLHDPGLATGPEQVLSTRIRQLLPMRLTPDAFPDLVVIEEGNPVPQVIPVFPQGPVLEVNSGGDEPDGNLNDGMCDTGSAPDNLTGLCTLRAALENAPSGGTISINVATIQLGGELVLSSGAAPNYTFLGNGVTVDASQIVCSFNCFYEGNPARSSAFNIGFSGDAGSAVFQNLSVRDAKWSGIRIRQAGQILVEGGTFSGNAYAGIQFERGGGQAIQGTFQIGGPSQGAGNTFYGNGTGLRASDPFGGVQTLTVQGNRFGDEGKDSNLVGASIGGMGNIIGGPSEAAGNRFENNSRTGLLVRTAGTDSSATRSVMVQGNTISGTGTGGAGVTSVGLDVANAIVGGESAGAANYLYDNPLISSNPRQLPVVVKGRNSDFIGNSIGLTREGSPGANVGVGIEGDNVKIGPGNVIAYNTGGVQIPFSSQNVWITENRIFANAQFAILDFETPEGDPRRPELTLEDCAGSPATCSSVMVHHQGAPPGSQVRIELFSVATCDPAYPLGSGGPGDQFLGSIEATSDGQGVTDLTAALPSPVEVAQGGLTATLTVIQGQDHNTSPFSNCATAPALGIVVNSLADFLQGDGQTALRPGATECDTGREVSGSPECTLRAAIEFAVQRAATAGADPEEPESIHFSIPGGAPKIIQPVRPLPEVTVPVDIDGRPDEDSCQATVALDGQNQGEGALLRLAAMGSSLRGLALYGSPESALVLGGEGNHEVQCNVIGAGLDNSPPAVPNQRHGVLILPGADRNRVGGSDQDSAGNRIAFNRMAGVRVPDAEEMTPAATGNAILGNRIHDNGGLGIDLGEEGPTPNDPAGDGDAGANDLQNFPQLRFEDCDPGRNECSSLRVFLRGNPDTTYRFQIFDNPTCDPSNFGEGNHLLLSVDETPPAGEDADLEFEVGLDPPLSPSQSPLTATATELMGGTPRNTSEFSACAGGRSILVNTVQDYLVDPADSSRGVLPGSLLCDTGRQVERAGLLEPECTLRGAIDLAGELGGTAASPVRILFDIPQLSAAGLEAAGGVIEPLAGLPVIETAVDIDARRIDPETGVCRPTIGLDGAPAGLSVGLDLVGEEPITLRGLAVYGFAEVALRLSGAGGHQVQCSHVGLNRAGDPSDRQQPVGILVLSPHNRIGTRSANQDGTPLSADRNVIAGQGIIGIQVESALNIIQGNFIGTNIYGLELGGSQQFFGIKVQGDDNLIGARQPAPGLYGQGPGNVISGNQYGVSIEGGIHNVIQGNAIGTDATGILPVGNLVGVQQSVGNSGGPVVQLTQIGGPDPASGNLVSGNASSGIEVFGGEATIRNNRVGTTPSGTSALPNLRGVRVDFLGGPVDEHPNVTVGSFDLSGANLISGNLGSGVELNAANQRVYGNLIGTQPDGESALGNGKDGIFIRPAGELSHLRGNTIAHNDRNGILVESGVPQDSVPVRIERNRIFRNGGLGISTSRTLGIHLSSSLKLETDPLAGAGGSPAEVIRVRGKRHWQPQIIEFFSSTECQESAEPHPLSEGERFLDSVTLGMAPAEGPFLLDIAAGNLIGPWITATTTLQPQESPADSTSNFSNCVFLQDFSPLGGILTTLLGEATITPDAETRIRGAMVADVPKPDDLAAAAGKIVMTPSEAFSIELGGKVDSASVQGGPPARFSVTLELPPAFEPDSFFNFGPTAEDHSNHWYEFLFDGDTGAEIQANQVVLHFVDGGRGDHDLEVNGQVSSFGVPLRQASRLLFPLDLATGGEFVGVAVSNLTPDQDDLLEFELYPDSSGPPGQLEGGDTRAIRELSASSQLAELAGQLFPVGSFPRTHDGWFELRSSDERVGSFFQFGTFDLSQLDGSVAITEGTSQLVFPRVFEGPTSYRGQPATTLLSIANPSGEEVQLTLQIHPFETLPLPDDFLESVNLTLAPRDSIHRSVAEIFGEGVDISRGFVELEVTGGPGVIGFERIQLLAQATVIGLNAVAVDSAKTDFFSAQFASQEGVLFTNLNLVNTGGQKRVLELTLISEGGEALSDPVEVQLAAGEQFSQDAAEIFEPVIAGAGLLPTGSPNFTASLKLESDGPGVVGDVIFGDPVEFQFAASLHLQADTFIEAVFSQVANVEGFFTGLALFNPGSVAAQVQIEVVAPDGTLVGQSELELAGGHRTSRLVPELVPDAEGQAGGYIRIRSDRPLIAQQLFAAFDSAGIRLFSAVPPTVIQ